MVIKALKGVQRPPFHLLHAIDQVTTILVMRVYRGYVQCFETRNVSVWYKERAGSIWKTKTYGNHSAVQRKSPFPQNIHIRETPPSKNLQPHRPVSRIWFYFRQGYI
ncbi:unnamed protein product [Cuscuta epithymum]|uniref:Uncharacterized protein n=1 Tax=Cuscuta epithymum TaxID=186058 RepID=A0AAV0DCF2_9ASTE|nr:unnamed protein product [Cuscuta epithymum]